MSTVLQPWVEELGWKMQSILMSGFRGPDNGDLPAVKLVNRWLRTISQNNADPSKDYMKEGELPTTLDVCDELEFCTAHYVHHFADSLRVVANFHPNITIKRIAWAFHEEIASEMFHFIPESDKYFNRRHRDKVEHA